MTVTLIVIGVLLILSGMFSGSETALTAASRPLMHQLDRNGNTNARLVNRMYAAKESLIGTILLGNNLVNILASSLATSLLIAMFGDAGIAYATIVMTLLVLIFSEILPKTYAFENADRIALRIAPVITLLIFIFMPITKTLQVVVSLTLRLLGMSAYNTEALSSNVDALRGAIELHDGEGSAVAHERAMLRSVLDLTEVEVEEIMTHRKTVVMIDADAPVSTIVDQVVDSPYTRIPLWRGDPDNVIGIIHAKELLRAVRAHGAAIDELDIESLTTKPWFIPEATNLLNQLQAFRQRREHFAVVIDEYGTMLGIVTLEDILEEIVGEISDEHDISVIGVRPQPDGSLIVDGTVTIRDLNRQFEWELPDDEAATIAGLVLHETRRIPTVGQVFRIRGLRVEILRRLRNQISSVRLTPPSPTTNGDADTPPDRQPES